MSKIQNNKYIHQNVCVISSGWRAKILHSSSENFAFSELQILLLNMIYRYTIGLLWLVSVEPDYMTNTDNQIGQVSKREWCHDNWEDLKMYQKAIWNPIQEKVLPKVTQSNLCCHSPIQPIQVLKLPHAPLPELLHFCCS